MSKDATNKPITPVPASDAVLVKRKMLKNKHDENQGRLIVGLKDVNPLLTFELASLRGDT